MEQSLKDRLVQYGLQRVIQPLEEAEVLFTDTLVLLSMRHIEKIGLSIGLQARLENFIKVIQSSPTNVPMSSGDSNDKLSGAAQHSQVQDLSDKIAASSSGAQHRPILVQNVQVSSELLNDCNSSSACQNKEPLQRSKKFCRSFLNLNLSEMLEKSIDGRLIVQFYKAKHFLNHGYRKELVRLVSNFLLEQTIELKSVDYLAISEKVVEIFPTETVEAYYIPCSAGVGSQASGKLVARCRNRRASILKAMRSFPSLADGVVDEPAEEDIGLDEMALEIDTKASVELLKSGAELEWNDVLIRWKQTATFRYQEIKDKQQNAASILNEWLPFKHKKGHTLVNIDFEQKYKGKENCLLENWKVLCEQLCHHMREEFSNENSMRLLLESIVTDCGRDLVVFLLLHKLLPPSLVYSQITKKRWRPSVCDSQDSFLIHLKDSTNVQVTIEKRQQKMEAHGLTLQPFVIAVGPSINEIVYCLIYVDSTYFKTKNVVEAVDLTFKIFQVFGIEYPKESMAVWTFLQKGLYKIFTKYDIKNSDVATMLANFNL